MSSPVRLRRLMADYKRVAGVFKGHPHIAVKKVYGNPPEKYEVEYKVKSLVSQNGRIAPKPRHTVEICLPLGYPRQAPVCRMLTPVFHPNIAPHAVCIGDHWAAGESLVHLVVRIGEMLAFQSYNIKSPLNGEAARWADQHREELPTDTADLEPEKRPEDIPVNNIEAEQTIPVARAIPVARPVPPKPPAIPVARPVPAAPAVRKPPPPSLSPSVSRPASAGPVGGAVRLTCKVCGRTRIAQEGTAASGRRCMYCGGEMATTWKEPPKRSG
jgi:ubiquitin-protein ligase